LVMYEDNVEVGEAKVIIECIVKYEGTLEESFIIQDNAISNISDLQTLYNQHVEAGNITNDEAIHAFKMHFQALAQFEKSGNNEKVVKHLNGFKDLLDYRSEERRI